MPCKKSWQFYWVFVKNNQDYDEGDNSSGVGIDAGLYRILFDPSNNRRFLLANKSQLPFLIVARHYLTANTFMLERRLYTVALYHQS